MTEHLRRALDPRRPPDPNWTGLLLVVVLLTVAVSVMVAIRDFARYDVMIVDGRGNCRAVLTADGALSPGGCEDPPRRYTRRLTGG